MGVIFVRSKPCLKSINRTKMVSTVFLGCLLENYSKYFNDLLALRFERSLPFGLLFLINLCCIVAAICDLVHDVDVKHDL